MKYTPVLSELQKLSLADLFALSAHANFLYNGLQKDPAAEADSMQDNIDYWINVEINVSDEIDRRIDKVFPKHQPELGTSTFSVPKGRRPLEL